MKPSRQYVNAAGEIRTFETETDLVEQVGTWWARLPTVESATEQMAFAKAIAWERGYEEEDLEPMRVFMAVPDGEGGYLRVPVAIVEGEWIACGPGLSSAEIREEGG